MSDTMEGNTEFGRLTYEWSTTPPSIAVVETVAQARDIDVTDIAPLYESIDPEALNHLIKSGGADVSISFPFADRNITVHGQGDVVVRPADSE